MCKYEYNGISMKIHKHCQSQNALTHNRHSFKIREHIPLRSLTKSQDGEISSSVRCMKMYHEAYSIWFSMTAPVLPARRGIKAQTSSWLYEGAENTPRHLKTQHRTQTHSSLKSKDPMWPRAKHTMQPNEISQTHQICVIHIWDGNVCAEIWETTCIYNSFIHSRNNTYPFCLFLRQPLQDICSNHPSSLNRRLCSQHLLSSWSRMCLADPKGGGRKEV